MQNSFITTWGRAISQASHREGPPSVPGRSVVKKSSSGTGFSSQDFSFPLSLSVNRCSMLIHTSVTEAI